MNHGLACGRCSRLVSTMRGPCVTCGRDPDAVRCDVERRVEQLLQVRAVLLASTDIYASYELSFVENELRGCGVDLHDRQPVPAARGARKTTGDSAAVGYSAISRTAPSLGELERLPPHPGGVLRDESARLLRSRRFSPVFGFGLDGRRRRPLRGVTALTTSVSAECGSGGSPPAVWRARDAIV